jgi:hypothetical protein
MILTSFQAAGEKNMSDSTRAVVILVLVMLLLLGIAFLGSTFLMKRALKQVITMLRDGQAVSPQSAKTEADLGLKRKGIFEIRGLRDYKPSALQLLIRHEIVQVTEDGRIFLAEENLAKTNLKV